jgi:hypothetical protein
MMESPFRLRTVAPFGSWFHACMPGRALNGFVESSFCLETSQATGSAEGTTRTGTPGKKNASVSRRRNPVIETKALLMLPHLSNIQHPASAPKH